MLEKSPIRGAFYLSLSSLLFMISGYLTNIFLGRSLGPQDYGIYGVVISLISIVNITQAAGLPQAISKFISEDFEKSEQILKSGFFLQIISSLLIAILFFLAAKPLAIILKDLNLVTYLQISALIFPFYGIYSLYTGYYNGLHNFSRQALINNVYYIAKAFMVLGLGYFYHLTGAIIGFVIAPFFTFLTKFHLPKGERNYSYRKLIIFSIPLIIFAIFSTLFQSIDLLFVKFFSPLSNNPGYYTASQNIARLPLIGLTSFAVILLPSISKSEAKQNNKISTQFIIHQSLRYILMLAIPFALVVSATSSQIIELLYSAKYLPGAHSLSILIFGYSFLGIFSALANILIGAGRPIYVLFISVLGVIILILFCTILIPIYGVIGAALSTSIGSLVAMSVAGYFVYRKLYALINILTLVKITMASLIIFIVAKLIIVPSIFLPFLYLILFGIYLMALVLLKEIKEQDYELMKKLLPSRFRILKNGTK
ncbi:flippase [Candidatus Daviesbacteria bacterium]|nr:flippase [Candidatus Daviesbacteria bacterium]